MDFTEKDLKNKLKTELVEIAKKMPGYNTKTHNKKDALIGFILKKEVVVKPTKKEELLAKASKYVDFKKTVHGSSIAKLEAFLAGKETNVAMPTTVEKAAVVVVQKELDIAKMPFNDLRKLAKTYGWTKRTGTKKELVEYINTRKEIGVGAAPEGRLDETVVVAAAPAPSVDEDIEEWPVSPEVLAKNSKTIDDLKKLLKAKGISTGLPRTKKEIMDLFKKSRCSFKKFTCSEDEFCDLRNNICRELNILRNKDKEIKKLAKGLVYIDENTGRFYGTPEAIARVRNALLQERPIVLEETKEEIIVPTAATSPSPLAPAVLQQQQQEEGISPININRLLDKPDENEIRRAILHCLGLYHDVDPNDEIILSSAT
jgi:hypothetical protein